MNKFEEMILESKRRQKQAETMDNGFTIGELISAVLSVKNEEDAKAFYDGYLEYLEYLWNLPEQDGEPEWIACSNIGWCFGEGMEPDKIRMWNEACGAAHPVFGVSIPTPQEAFEAGKKFSQD